MEDILRAPHCVPGGPWPGAAHPIELATVECWHVKVPVAEEPHLAGAGRGRRSGHFATLDHRRFIDRHL